MIGAPAWEQRSAKLTQATEPIHTLESLLADVQRHAQLIATMDIDDLRVKQQQKRGPKAQCASLFGSATNLRKALSKAVGAQERIDCKARGPLDGLNDGGDSIHVTQLLLLRWKGSCIRLYIPTDRVRFSNWRLLELPRQHQRRRPLTGA